MDYIEGEPAKRFVVYVLDLDGRPVRRVGEYDSIAEVRAHRWRLDQRYNIRVGGKFMTKAEFDQWAVGQER